MKTSLITICTLCLLLQGCATLTVDRVGQFAACAVHIAATQGGDNSECYQGDRK